MEPQPQPSGLQPGLLQQHALPTPTPTVPVVPVPTLMATPKHFLAAFFLSFFLGVFGADRFYLGYYVQGVLKFLTFGWFGIGAMIDLGIIMGGGMRDAKGQPLVGYEEYKGLAKRTIGWITAGGVVLVVFLGVSTFITLTTVAPQIMPLFSGGLDAITGGQLGAPQTSGEKSADSLLKSLQ